MSNKKDRQARAETGGTEGTAEKAPRAEKGTSITSKVKAAFLEILGEWLSSQQVNAGTLDQYKELFDNLSLQKGAGMPPEIQLANIKSIVDEMFESKNVDQEKLRILLNRQDRIKRSLKKASEPQTEQGETASA